MRILFHAPGLAAFRPAASLPHLLGVQPTVTGTLGGVLASHKLTGNRGNIIHAEAPAKTFVKATVGSAYGNLVALQQNLGLRYAEIIASNYDLIIISMANFIRPNHNGAALAKALQGLNESVPFIVLGCGLQGSHQLSDMLPGNRELIAHFNKHALVFGVRGETTANWLTEHGFGNATVLGCPSLYAYPDSILKIDGTAARMQGDRADVMTAGHLSMHNGNIVPRGVELAKAFEHVKASYVFQDEFFAYGSLPTINGLYNEGASEVAAGPVNEWLTKQIDHKVNFERYYYFSEASAWRQASLRHHVFIGDRFHGGVAALQAGQPAIFLTHDNRVSELTGHFGLPNLTTQDFARRGLKDTLDEFLSPEVLDAMKVLYKRRYAEFFQTMAPFGLRPEIEPDMTGQPNRQQSQVSAPAVRTAPKQSDTSADTLRIVRQGRYALRLVKPEIATELVITFEAADTTIDRSNTARKGFGEEFLIKNGYAVLSILTSSANWFRPPAILTAFENRKVKDFLSQFDKIHSYGSSMGGFGALTFADLLGISNVVALQPISSLAYDLAPWEDRFKHGRSLDWSGAYRDACQGIRNTASIYALFDPASQDSRHIARLEQVAGSRLLQIHVANAKHAVPRFLLQKGLLGPAVLACLKEKSKAEIASIIASR